MRCVGVVVGLFLPMVLMAPGAAQALALRTSTDTRIDLDLDLDLGRRQISVIRAGQRLGPWPVAIGDAQTPTPKGTFTIVSKQVNPVYLSIKGGQRRELMGASSPIGDRYIGFHHEGRRD
ncbi:L/D-transpeptidase catalytic domain protein [Synechococcus sp. RS9915]|nr:L/D-transpeptidase catalytic domain protein [Synechococcus sp. RS9915]